jgi:hypothetical protein
MGKEERTTRMVELKRAADKEIEESRQRRTLARSSAEAYIKEAEKAAEEKALAAEAYIREIRELEKPIRKPRKKMPSMLAERQAMGAEDKPPLAVRQPSRLQKVVARKKAEQAEGSPMQTLVEAMTGSPQDKPTELTPEQFERLVKPAKQAILRDLVLKNPDLILTLRDNTGKDVQRGLSSPKKATTFNFTVQELDAAYRKYKGSTGRGVIQWDKPNMSSRGKIMGHGIAHLVEKKAEKPKLYAPFGRYYIQKMKLDDNILQFKSHSGLQPNELPTERVSKQLANVIHTFLRETPNYEEINQLNDHDKLKLATICKKCHIMSPAVPKLKTLTDQEDDRFEVLRGQLIAGNDNKQLAKEFKVLMLKMVSEGRIPKRQANEIMHELLILDL